MGLEEKPMPRALMTPGREDLSPWPPVGQLEFQKITAMDEPQLDRAFKERHGLSSVFEENSYSEPRLEGRRIELKRIVLARLEGYSMYNTSSPLNDWIDPLTARTENVEDALQATLSNALTQECRERIGQVWKRVAREAAIEKPPERLHRIELKINALLSSHNLEPITIQEIFRSDKIPRHAASNFQGLFDIEQALTLFYLRLEGTSEAECAERIAVDKETISSFCKRYFSHKAKNLIREIRGWKKLD